MKKSLTGAGGLPRKLSAILIASAMLLSGLTFAADNSIYVDQAGDNTSVYVNQDGTTNVVRGIQGVGTSNATPAKIYGDGNQVNVNQVGSNNTLNFGIKTTTANGATSGNTFNYNVTGNNATATINSNNNGQGTSASNNVDITQNGNYASANVNVLGSQNSLTATTSGGSYNAITSNINGDNNIQNIAVSGGSNNAITIGQGDPVGGTTSNNKGMTDVTVLGASNTVGINQTGGALNGHQATVNIDGSSTTVDIVQQGTAADNIVNIKSVAGVGGGNLFTIRQNAR
jgi:hypothetical protein